MFSKTVDGQKLLLLHVPGGRFVWHTYDERIEMGTDDSGKIIDVLYKHLRATEVSGATWREAVQNGYSTWELISPHG